MALQRNCPDCKKPLVPVHASELADETRNASLNTIAVSILSYFTYYICVKCGLTISYADSRAKRIAEDLSIDQGGHS